ncbi:hypothetical protein GE09DRAFT_368195 [Coniochaeta sp. 2T2.1]|nr:hypothetical protein GE09DRAFT_368195 [Coniochaeta sp. 2T2.1]
MHAFCASGTAYSFCSLALALLHKQRPPGSLLATRLRTMSPPMTCHYPQSTTFLLRMDFSGCCHRKHAYYVNGLALRGLERAGISAPYGCTDDVAKGTLAKWKEVLDRGDSRSSTATLVVDRPVQSTYWRLSTLH